MQELSMNVLDVAENSVAAGATLVAITLSIDTAAKRMTLTITDNGKGMPPEMAAPRSVRMSPKRLEVTTI